MLKHKINLILYLIMGGFCSAWCGTMIKFAFNNFSFWMFTLLAVYEFAFWKSCVGIADCVFKISKEKMKMEDSENATKRL